MDTKRRGVGTGPEVRSEGQGVKGHSQLDSTQEEVRVRKEGGKVSFAFSACFFSKSGGCWMLTLNRGSEMKN